MRRPTSALLRPGNAVVVALAVAVVLSAFLLFQRNTSEPSTDSPAAPAVPISEVAADPVVSALWVGDDFTAGVGGIDRAAYAQIVCQRVGWACNVDAQGSTGFVNDGAVEYDGATARIGNRLDFDKKTYKADIVLVDGGRNDLNQPASTVGPAMVGYIRDVRKAWPQSKIVVIVPAYMSSEPYEIYDRLLTYLDEVSAEVGATLIDPVAEGWYDGVDVAAMQLEDGVHPNAAGNAFIAGIVEKDLVDRGLAQAPPVTGSSY